MDIKSNDHKRDFLAVLEETWQDNFLQAQMKMLKFSRWLVGGVRSNKMSDA